MLLFLNKGLQKKDTHPLIVSLEKERFIIDIDLPIWLILYIEVQIDLFHFVFYKEILPCICRV